MLQEFTQVGGLSKKAAELGDKYLFIFIYSFSTNGKTMRLSVSMFYPLSRVEVFSAISYCFESYELKMLVFCKFMIAKMKDDL